MAGSDQSLAPIEKGQYIRKPRGVRMVMPNEVVGMPAPSFEDINALNQLAWTNAASYIGSTGYDLIRTTDCTANAVGTYGDEIGALRLRVFGTKAGVDPEDPEAGKPENQSELAKWMQRGLKLAWGMAALQKRWVWSFVEGVLFWQIRWHHVPGWGLAPDVRWGERRKVGAGGYLRLHPDHEHIVVVERQQNFPGFAEEPARILSPLDWMIFKPGTSPNPEGDSELAIRFYRHAKLYQEGDKNGAVFAKSMTLPILMFQWIADKVKIGQLATRNEEIANAIDWTAMTEMLLLGEDGKKTVADLLVYPTDGAQYLLDRETRIEGRSTKALQNTVMLTDTRATGPSGSSYQARDTANKPTLVAADVFANAVTIYLLTSMVIRNEMMFPGSVPRLMEGELPPRAQMVMPENEGEDTNPSKTSMPVVDPNKRPIPEGNSKKGEDSDEVK